MVENHSKIRMSKPEFPTRVEARAGRTMSPAEIFDVANRREKGLSRLLVAYISTGLVFMLLPGTFLGVWNHFVLKPQTNGTMKPQATTANLFESVRLALSGSGPAFPPGVRSTFACGEKKLITSSSKKVSPVAPRCWAYAAR